MRIDLHTHSYPVSPCSGMNASELLAAAQRTGLDGVCVTDHLFARGGFYAQALAPVGGIPVFRGVEARTTLGDILVFGLDEDYAEGIDGETLLWHVRQMGGASILAHPFRHAGGWALWYWLKQRGLALDSGLTLRREFAYLDAVEVLNGGAQPAEVEQARLLSEILSLPATGGSDAHAPGHVGRMYTEFERQINSEAELVTELRAGRVSPAAR
jgi:predicted metal-dependent phosphoesterase TrpH